MTLPIGCLSTLFSVTARVDGDETYVVLLCSECAANGPAGGRISVWPVGPSHVVVSLADLSSAQRAHWDTVHGGTSSVRNAGGVVVCDG
jgi:hypothetical protein